MREAFRKSAKLRWPRRLLISRRKRCSGVSELRGQVADRQAFASPAFGGHEGVQPLQELALGRVGARIEPGLHPSRRDEQRRPRFEEHRNDREDQHGEDGRAVGIANREPQPMPAGVEPGGEGQHDLDHHEQRHHTHQGGARAPAAFHQVAAPSARDHVGHVDRQQAREGVERRAYQVARGRRQQADGQPEHRQDRDGDGGPGP